MKTLITLMVWVTVNGLPVESLETCAMAKTKAAELQQQLPDLLIRAECDAAHKPNSKVTIAYYGPRKKTKEVDKSQ